jgi:hypothetical protein
MKMSLDKELIEAIEVIAAKQGQSHSLEKRLISWLEYLSSGDIKQKEDSEHLQSLIRSVDIE